MNTYSQEELEQAFSRVQNKDDWKAEIKSVIKSEDWQITKEAIIHFTATMPTLKEENGRYIVSAIGYRMGPAGDH